MLQFVPGDLELPFRALVLKAVKPHVFDQDVQAVNKSASGRIPVFAPGCGGSRNTSLLRLRCKVNAQGKWMHVTEVIGLSLEIGTTRVPGRT